MNFVNVVLTGVANIASVEAAFARLGVEVRYCSGPNELRSSAPLVLPGVGAFGAGMAELERCRATEALRERIFARQPTLAVCLGLQLLCVTSEETPGVCGISALECEVRRFSSAAGLRVPQIGWNKIESPAESLLLRSGFAYFANSYCLRQAPVGFVAALAEYDGPFVAAIEDGPVLACQFHPELSGPWGRDLIRRWYQQALGGLAQ